MVAQAKRRVIKSGPSSRVIVLPLDWCEGSGLAPGTEVSVRYGRLLLVVPPGGESQADRLIRAIGGSL